jgi:hypothetical protein
LLLLGLLSLLDLQLQLLDFVLYLCLRTRVSLDQDKCPVSICSLRVLLAPIPAYVLCIPFSLSLSLSPTSPALASLFPTSLALASPASPFPDFLSPASPSSASLFPASLALASLAALAQASLALASPTLASLALASLALASPIQAAPALAYLVQSASVQEAPILSASLNQARCCVFAFRAPASLGPASLAL